MMKDVFFTIAGMKHYYGSDFSESITYDFGDIFGDMFGNMPPRESDDIGCKIIEQSVILYVSWNLE